MQLQYLSPGTVKDAVSLLNKYREKAKVIAGGTDLVIQIKNRVKNPEYLVDLTGVPSLNHIDFDARRGLRIGALTSVRALETSPEIKQKYPIIAQAASQLGSVAIRNVATIGGNLCNALPSAELSQAMMALSASTRIIGPQGERELPIEDFFKGVGLTALAANEILSEINIPALPPNTRGVYTKHSLRGSIDLAIVNVAVLLNLSDGGRVCQDIRIVLGAVAPTPIRARKAESILRGEKVNPGLIDRVAQQAADEAHPRAGSIRGSVEYKKEMVMVYTRRLINEAIAQKFD